MPSKHKHAPVSFRPTEEDRARLLAYAAQSGRPVNAILARALSLYLDRVAPSTKPGKDTP